MDLEPVVAEAFARLEEEGVDAFEVAGISEQTLSVEAKRQMVESFERSSSAGIALRVVHKKRLGWSATTDLSSSEIKKAVKSAVDSAKFSAETKEAVIASPQIPSGDFAERVGRSFSEISDDDKIDLALSLESAAIASDSRISRVRSPKYEEVTSSVFIRNSNGISASGRRSMAYLTLQAIATDKGDSESSYEIGFSPRFEDLEPKAVAASAAARAIRKLGARGMDSAFLPAVFENRAAASLLGVLAPAFFADNVQRNKSPVARRKGEMVYSDLIDIIDDGLLSGGFASFPFDGEGVPSQKTTIVHGGRIVGWLYDGPRAAIDGVKSTGNCRRTGIGKTPSIGVTNCFIKAGSSSLKSIISSAKKGLFVTGLLGVHTANPITGDFSLGAEGIAIEDGVLDRPVRGITIAGNVHEIFRDVVAVGNDFVQKGAYASPSIMIKSISIGG